MENPFFFFFFERICFVAYETNLITRLVDYGTTAWLNRAWACHHVKPLDENFWSFRQRCDARKKTIESMIQILAPSVHGQSPTTNHSVENWKSNSKPQSHFSFCVCVKQWAFQSHSMYYMFGQSSARSSHCLMKQQNKISQNCFTIVMAHRRIVRWWIERSSQSIP